MRVKGTEKKSEPSVIWDEIAEWSLFLNTILNSFFKLNTCTSALQITVPNRLNNFFFTDDI